MSRLLSFACALMFAGIMTQPVFAADIIEEPPFDWTGFIKQKVQVLKFGLNYRF